MVSKKENSREVLLYENNGVKSRRGTRKHFNYFWICCHRRCGADPAPAASALTLCQADQWCSITDREQRWLVFVSNWREVLFAIMRVQRSTGRGQRLLLWAESANHYKSQRLVSKRWRRELVQALVTEQGFIRLLWSPEQTTTPKCRNRPRELECCRALANSLCTPRYVAPLPSVLPRLRKWHKSSSAVLQTTLQHVALDTRTGFLPNSF